MVLNGKNVFKNYPLRIILASLCILLFICLKTWNSFAPWSTHDWNKKEFSRIKVSNPEDFTFAVFGDNKGNHSVFEPLLRDINQSKEIAFAMDVGDLVRDGKRGQFQHLLDQVQKNLTIPFVTAIGNHDLNNGSSIYQEIFGPTYYAFQVGQCYFIVLDATVESGFDKTEYQWLENELQKAQAFQGRLIFMHVPLFDPRGGGSNNYLGEDSKNLLDLFKRYKVTHLFASHIHGYFRGEWEGIPYTITGGAGGRLQGKDPQQFFYHYMKVHVSKGKVEMIARRVHPESLFVRFFGIIEDDPVGWGLIFLAGALLISIVFSARSKRDPS